MGKVLKYILYGFLGLIVLLLILWFLMPKAAAGLSCSALPPDQKDHCYKWVAEQKGNPALCEQVTGEGPKGVAPKAQCYENIALDKNDITICEMIVDVSIISTNSDRCAQRVARAMNDPSQCDKLKDPETKGACKASFQ